MQLRVRSAEGVCTLKGIDSSTTVLQLKMYVSERINIPVSALQLKCGYPPAPVQVKDERIDSIDTAGVRSGDTLIAEAPNTMAKSTPRRGSAYGVVVLREVPADNNCLFTAVARATGAGTAQTMRDTVARVIRSNASGLWSEAVLERSPAEYSDLIENKDVWGGAIEMAILSEALAVEIAAFDIISCRCDAYGQGQFKKRLMLAYSGIHYDLLGLAPHESAHPKDDKLLVDVGSAECEDAERQALELVKEQNSKKQFTDTANFKLKCHTCGQQLKGEAEAREHASNTGHANFTEND